MTTQFEFHLLGADAPEGELDADQLIEIVTSLKEIATKIGRSETGAEPIGRAPNRTQQVAKLTIGLAPGSTTIRVHRTGVAGALDFDSAEELTFDQKFADLVQAFAHDERPDWVDDSLALATSHLVTALQHAAPDVEFTAGGTTQCAFSTAAIHRKTWDPQPPPSVETITFVGRLYAVNLKTHRLQVHDDVGNEVALPKVRDATAAGQFLGAYVTVHGTPGYSPSGRLAQITGAEVGAGPELPGLPEDVSLEEILASAPGLEPGKGLDLSDAEFEEFLAAMGR